MPRRKTWDPVRKEYLTEYLPYPATEDYSGGTYFGGPNLPKMSSAGQMATRAGGTGRTAAQNQQAMLDALKQSGAFRASDLALPGLGLAADIGFGAVQGIEEAEKEKEDRSLLEQRRREGRASDQAALDLNREQFDRTADMSGLQFLQNMGNDAFERAKTMRRRKFRDALLR